MNKHIDAEQPSPDDTDDLFADELEIFPDNTILKIQFAGQSGTTDYVFVGFSSLFSGYIMVRMPNAKETFYINLEQIKTIMMGGIEE